MSAFLRDFDLYFCKLFDGARHDSGDPFAWGERLLDHYRKNRVDPLTKTLIFSDALTVPRTIELYQQFRGRCQLALELAPISPMTWAARQRTSRCRWSSR